MHFLNEELRFHRSPYNCFVSGNAQVFMEVICVYAVETTLFIRDYLPEERFLNNCKSQVQDVNG